jgi:nonsense-mediated mRNA decay protein 3
MTSIKVYERSDELREATVISQSGSEIQVMHPDNYSTIDLRIPEGYEVGDTVKVVNIDDVLYMVP